MKSLRELREYIYSFLDVEVFDIAEALLDTWAKEGYDRIVKVARRLPHFEEEFAAVTAPNDRVVPLPEGCHSIDLIIIDGVMLDPIPLREAMERFGQQTGTPRFFSVHAGNIHLWPTPSAQFDVEIHGWREPVDWVALSGEPDMPEQFESVLLSYMLYRAYGHQGLIEDQMVERQEFDSQLAQLTNWEKEAPTQSPMILGGSMPKKRHGSPFYWG